MSGFCFFLKTSTQSELFCPLQTFMSPRCRTGALRCCTCSLMFSQLVRCVREPNTSSLQGSNCAFVFVYRGPSLFASLFPLICIFHEERGLADGWHHAFLGLVGHRAGFRGGRPAPESDSGYSFLQKWNDKRSCGSESAVLSPSPSQSANFFNDA